MKRKGRRGEGRRALKTEGKREETREKGKEVTREGRRREVRRVLKKEKVKKQERENKRCM